MRKKLFFGFIMLLLTAGIPLTLIAIKNQQDTRSRASTEAVTFSFNPNQTQTSPNQEVPVTVRINSSGNSIAAIDFTLIYNKTLLELMSVDDSNSEFGVNIFPNTPNNTTGELRYSATAKNNTPVNNSEIDVAIFKFKAKNSSGVSQAAIGFSAIKAATSGQADNNLASSFQEGTITIATGDPPPDNTSKPLVCEYYGDINEDNVLSGDDATLILQIATGGTFTVTQKSNADLDNNGQIEAADANILRRYLAGLETTFTACANHPICTNPNSFSPTVLGCEQCLACGTLTWCENSQSGTDRLSRCASDAAQCQSMGGIPKTTCPAQITDNPVCESLIADITSGPPPLKVKFTVIAKNEFGGISNIRIEGGDIGNNSIYASGGDWNGHTKTYSYDLTYATPGTYTAKATVYGSDDAKSATSVACTKTITVGSVPTRTPTPSPTPTSSPTPTASPTPTRAPLVCDNDKDNDIDTDDYNVWLTEFRNGTGTRSDCDGTQGVGIFDYAKWLGEYRKYVAANNP